MFCYKCGTQLPDGAAFCIKCGAKMQTEETGATKEETPVAEEVNNDNGDFKSYLNDYIFNLTRCKTAEEFLASDVQPKEKQSGLIYGAAVMAYPGALDRISERLGSDLVILPSSIHEVIVVPHREDDDFQQFEEMVKDVNRTQVANEEILSNTVYLYQRSTGKVTLPLAAAA